MLVHYHPELLPAFRKAVLTIGTFDGVHRGHRELIERIKAIAHETGGESVLITFDPHPRSVVFPDDTSLRLLSTTEEKIKLLDALDVDHLVVVPFTKDFSLLTARQYVEDFLIRLFHPSVIVIGYNHQFGHHRDGNIELLRKLSGKFHFREEEISKQMVDEIEVSSTRIRIALQEGDISTATQLLGHRYSLTGTVVKGNQLGRTLGFPTANLKPDNPYKLVPADGVYAITAQLGSQPGQLNGVMSIGMRPTVNGSHRTIEAHLFQFNKEVYGEKITVTFEAWLREEIKFDSVPLMVEEMKRDVTKANAFLHAK